jgi:excisionase family DNA binding protein
VTTLAAALFAELGDDELRELASRLRPFLDREHNDDLLTPAQAARRLGVHTKTITRAAGAGRVTGAVRVGRAWRFRSDGLSLDPPAGVAPAPAKPARPKSVASSAVHAIRGVS